MTIKLRERLYWLFFAMSLAGLLATIATLWFTGTGAIERVRASFFSGESIAAFYSVIVVAIACAVFGAVVSAFVALRSGKTASVEIFFFSVWALCQSLELAKVFMVAIAARGAGANVFEAVTRIALLGRYLGSLALFAGSLFAVGLRQERSLPLFGAIVLAAMLFATIQPLNSVGPGADLLADRGLALLAVVFELAIVGLALVNYLIAWRSSQDRAYLYAGLGIVVVIVASMLLKATQSPWIAGITFPFLVAGAAFYTRSLHDYYLWR